jgi:hypothetical protein
MRYNQKDCDKHLCLSVALVLKGDLYKILRFVISMNGIACFAQIQIVDSPEKGFVDQIISVVN